MDRMSTHRTTTATPTPWPHRDTVAVTDAGLETWLVFHRGTDLRGFAAYPLVADEAGRRLLVEYYEQFVAIARSIDAAVILEAPTWRANPDWAATLGHDRDELARFIVAAIQVVADVRDRSWTGEHPFLIGGTVGPRGDGYQLGDVMDVAEAQAYHSFQIEQMAAAGADVISGMTIGYVDEAVGISNAAQAVGLPAVISFTLETDGRLPSGMSLGEAIEATDAATGRYPTHYMINCAHPTHFDSALDGDPSWASRIGGLRANASTLSHAELDNALELDEGDPADLARRYVALKAKLPAVQVIGGCCGTDHRHVAAIADAWHTAATA